MKVTIELPDDLYRRVKAQAALSGRSVREVTTELFQLWLGESRPADNATAQDWLQDWIALGNTALGDERPEKSATEILDADRSRLDPKR